MKKSNYKEKASALLNIDAKESTPVGAYLLKFDKLKGGSVGFQAIKSRSTPNQISIIFSAPFDIIHKFQSDDFDVDEVQDALGKEIRKSGALDEFEDRILKALDNVVREFKLK